jgi:peptide/nickel transport system ATP-binding protein
MSATLLEVEGLCTHFETAQGVIRAVDDVSFTVAAGEVLGLVGESGSGKSMTGYSIMRLVDPPGRVVAGAIRFGGRDLAALTEGEMRALRGTRLAMIFQDPMATLNPVLRIDTQLIEAVRAHRRVSRRESRALAREALVRVGIPSPDERLRAYPHQFSGGMRQRVAIAIAMLNRPELIICDEPTTALDVTIQGQILHEMQALSRESGAALIWISHDLSVVAGLADRIAVMYAGRIVEQGSAQAVLGAPRHPYTRGLLDSIPGDAPPRTRLKPVPGMPPWQGDLPRGCAFSPRCARATAMCEDDPPMRACGALGQAVRCHHPLTEPEA